MSVNDGEPADALVNPVLTHLPLDKMAALLADDISKRMCF